MSINRHFVITTILLSLISCNKKSDNPPLTLEGTWELLTVEGPLVGRQTYPRGNGNTFTFDNNTYSQNVKYDDTSYRVSGTFSVFLGKPCEQFNEQTVIQFDTSVQIPNVFTFSGTTFTISTPRCLMDGGSSTYRRILP